MRIWYTCSYRGSPVGYQLGYLDTGTLSNQPAASLSAASEALKDCPPLRVLERCLMFDELKEALGQVPGAEHLYAAVRPIPCRDENDTGISLAFDTTDEAEFLSIAGFLKRYRNKDEELYRKMLPTLIKKPSDERFGYQIDTEKLREVLEEIRSGEADAPEDGFFVRTKYAGEGAALIKELRVPEGSHIELYKLLGENWFQIVDENMPALAEVEKEVDETNDPFCPDSKPPVNHDNPPSSRPDSADSADGSKPEQGASPGSGEYDRERGDDVDFGLMLALLGVGVYSLKQLSKLPKPVLLAIVGGVGVGITYSLLKQRSTDSALEG